jgi:hypothetical protein
MPSLLDLSAELKIMIVQSLDLPDLPARTGDDDYTLLSHSFRYRVRISSIWAAVVKSCAKSP